MLKQEQTVADAVNSLVQALGGLNRPFASLASSLGIDIGEPLWSGSLKNLAGHQLKWIYPTTADDNEFLKRATLACTLVIDELRLASTDPATGFLFSHGRLLTHIGEEPYRVKRGRLRELRLRKAHIPEPCVIETLSLRSAAQAQ